MCSVEAFNPVLHSLSAAAGEAAFFPANPVFGQEKGCLGFARSKLPALPTRLDSVLSSQLWEGNRDLRALDERTPTKDGVGELKGQLRGILRVRVSKSHASRH